MFFERVQGNDIYGAATNPPFSFHPAANDVYFSTPTTTVNGVPAPPGPPTVPAGLTDLSYYYPNPATAQYSLGIQQQLAPAVVGVIQYVGSTGWNQSDQRAINTLPLADLTDRGSSGQRHPSQRLQTLSRAMPASTRLKARQTATTTRFRRECAWKTSTGSPRSFPDTWSHEIDIQSGDLGSTNISGFKRNLVSTHLTSRYDRGSGVLDRRHIFSANYDYALPFFKSGANLVEREVLGGWELSGVTVAEAGSPVNVTYLN